MGRICGELALDIEPLSSRSSARLTAPTSGVISEGRFFSGSRIDMAPGVIAAAILDISSIGLKAL